MIRAMSDVKLRSRMKNLLLFLPNLLVLCARLMVDPRVPVTERVLVAGAIVYALIPFDFKSNPLDEMKAFKVTVSF